MLPCSRGACRHLPGFGISGGCRSEGIGLDKITSSTTESSACALGVVHSWEAVVSAPVLGIPATPSILHGILHAISVVHRGCGAAEAGRGAADQAAGAGRIATSLQLLSCRSTGSSSELAQGYPLTKNRLYRVSRRGTLTRDGLRRKQ